MTMGIAPINVLHECQCPFVTYSAHPHRTSRNVFVALFSSSTLFWVVVGFFFFGGGVCAVTLLVHAGFHVSIL